MEWPEDGTPVDKEPEDGFVGAAKPDEEPTGLEFTGPTLVDCGFKDWELEDTTPEVVGLGGVAVPDLPTPDCPVPDCCTSEGWETSELEFEGKATDEPPWKELWFHWAAGDPHVEPDVKPVPAPALGTGVESGATLPSVLGMFCEIW